MKGIKFGGLVTVTALMALAGGIQACGDDDNGATTTPDAGTTPTPTPPPNPPPNPPPPSDAGDASSSTVNFTVPAGGGSVDFASPAGKITFAFPASAAGKAITLAPTSDTAIGWAAGQFTAAIKMGPDGTRFTDPVTLSFEKKNLVGAVLSFPETGATKGPAAPLDFDTATGTYRVRHFTTLVIVPPDKMCDSQGYSDTPSSARCGDAGASSTFRQITCKGYNFCAIINATCCVDPAVDSGTTCSVENQIYGISVTPTGSNGGQYPYCDVDAGDWDGGDAGSACASTGLTYIYNQNGGCSVVHDCGPIYRMDCDGAGACSCYTQAPQSVGPTFTSAGACDTAAAMKTTFVQKCNYPPN